MLNLSQRRLLLLSALGGVLEFYDFVIYALLAVYIASAFFPFSHGAGALLATFATFSVGYFARPVGGVLLGHFGDKYGRKRTFTFSILLMALATLCMAFTPTYANIGIAAPIILTGLRILQGISVGGEIPGAVAYVSESMPERKGLACGIIFFSLTSGVVLGSLAIALLKSFISTDAMYSWGWRIPFFIGGIFGIFSYFMRRNLEEPKMFTEIKGKLVTLPIVEVLHSRPTNALCGGLIVSTGASAMTLLLLFMPTYMSQVLHKVSNAYSWFQVFTSFMAAIFSIFIGILADKIGAKKVVYLVVFSGLICALPIFIIFAHHFSWYLLALLLSAYLSGAGTCSVAILLPELFETHYRYSGIALSYNIGYALFGGLTPLIAMLLIDKTGLTIAPAFYLMGVYILAYIALQYAKATKLSGSL